MALEENSMIVTFYEDALYNKSESRVKGVEVFTDTLMVRIKQINSMDEVNKPASEADIRRFSKSYEAYKSGIAAPEEGTPLVECHEFKASEVKMLAANSIKTLEVLVEVSDAALQRMGPGMLTLKAKGQKAMASKAQLRRVMEENAQMREVNAQLEARIEALENLSKPKPKKVGRPRKVNESTDNSTERSQ